MEPKADMEMTHFFLGSQLHLNNSTSDAALRVWAGSDSRAPARQGGPGGSPQVLSREGGQKAEGSPGSSRRVLGIA